MRFTARIWLAGVVACGVVAMSAPVAQGAGFGIEKFFAGNCSQGHEECGQEKIGPLPIEGESFTYYFPKEPNLAETEAQGYTQAGGHVPYGITAFKIATEGSFPAEVPAEGKILTHIRTDVAPGLSTNPTAVPQCTQEEFGDTEISPGSGLYPPPGPKCAGSIIGTNRAVIVVEPAKGVFLDVPLEGKAYNLVQPNGLSSDFGVALELPKLLTEGHTGFFAHTFIEGNVEWGKEAKGTNAGDYHDYFEIKVSPKLPLISSILIFEGNNSSEGKPGDFITNATSCPGNNTTTLHLTEDESTTVTKPYTTLVGLTGCNLVPFEPGFALAPETVLPDQPDGITAEATVPHASGPLAIDSAQVDTGTFALPEGMTLNPSAAHGLEACKPSQARIHSSTFGMECPAKSEIGTATLDVPDLPSGSLTGNVYLGGPESGPITKPPYTIYVQANSARYGISVRLEGEVIPNESTGRVTTIFAKNPEQPFSNLTLKLNGGPKATLANPLVCGGAKTETSFTPYTGLAAAFPSSAFTVTGATCPATPPFSLTQNTTNSNATAGGYTSYTVNLTRADGQQYLSKVSTTLPEGLLAAIPSVTLCGEAEANAGTCPATSKIGTARVKAGAGESYEFSGPVYMTGPYAGAPYGMSIVVPANAGPFELGNVITRATINVNPYTGRITVTANVPTIKDGIPLRLKNLSIAVEKEKFLFNPTNCGALATESTLSGTPTLPVVSGATQNLSSTFSVTGCSSLAFKPKFTAASNGKTSRTNGVSLTTKITYTGGQANLQSVLVTLPKQLPSRLTTLHNACPEATFNANPWACPKSSRVGGATVVTPVLPNKLTGPAFFVSHGGAAFPDLDLVVTGNGVTIILVGNTNIKNGVTSTKFATLPDAPVTSAEVNLPIGSNSALGAPAGVCKQSLVMPTTLTAQSGKVIKQNTPISVSGCPVTILSRRISGQKAIVTLRAPAAGRVSASGTNLKTVYKYPGKAKTVTLEVPLSSTGLNALAARSPLTVRLRVGFLPKKGQSSTAYTTVVFK
jgi:hypothetical protein